MVCPPGGNSSEQTPCLAASLVPIVWDVFDYRWQTGCRVMKVRFEQSYRPLKVVRSDVFCAWQFGNAEACGNFPTGMLAFGIIPGGRLTARTAGRGGPALL